MVLLVLLNERAQTHITRHPIHHNHAPLLYSIFHRYLLGAQMFDHVKFGVSDYEKSKTFFLEALRPLGVNIIDEGTPDYGVEMSSGDVSLCLYQTHDKPAPLHIAFVATTRQQVDDFYNAALRTGAQDNGAPGLRSYGKNYYAAFVIAPDGHNIEAVCHAPESGSLD